MSPVSRNETVTTKLTEFDRDIETGNVHPLPPDLEKSMMKVLENSGHIDTNEIEITGDVDL
jgi:hypothetical protein